MNSRSEMYFCGLMIAALVGAGGAAAWVASRHDPRISADQPMASKDHAVLAAASRSSRPPLDSYSVIWNTDLCRSFEQAAPPTTAPPSAVASSPGFTARLVATGVDEQHPYAMFIDSNQDSVVCGQNESVEGLKIISIEAHRVVGELGGVKMEVAVPDEFDGTASPVAASSITPTQAPGGVTIRGGG